MLGKMAKHAQKMKVKGIELSVEGIELSVEKRRADALLCQMLPRDDVVAL